jgi:uncharacterized membrane protein (UPF0136 family)
VVLPNVHLIEGVLKVVADSFGYDNAFVGNHGILVPAGIAFARDKKTMNVLLVIVLVIVLLFALVGTTGR